MIRDDLGVQPGFSREEGERRAVIDIGSNTVRLVIYNGPPRAPAVLWNEKVSARLGRDLALDGDIPETAMEEALAALARYALILSEHGITNVETVATAASREAGNGPAFVRRIEELGLAVRVLRGEEEARASAYGAIGAFPGADGVVADLGGGSLELIEISGGGCGAGATFPLGTLRLPSLRAGDGFDRKVAEGLEMAGWTRDGRPLYMIGGTWRALATFAMRSSDHPLTDPHGFILGADEAAAIAGVLVRSKPAQLAQQPGISKMRAEKLPDAAALLRILLADLKPSSLVFSSWGLREGLLYRSLSETDRARDPLREGVAAFTALRSIGEDNAAALAGWTGAVRPIRDDRSASLHFAAAHLAIALQRVEPNLRASQALEWALDKRWIGIDFTGRAMLAAALRGSLGRTAPHPRLTSLATESELKQATAWGLAFRLAQRLGAGAIGPLSASKLSIDAARVELQLQARHGPLAAPAVQKDLAALANWLDLAPQLSVVD